METWFFILIISLFVSALFSLLSPTKKTLPPSPFILPTISSFLLLRKSFFQIESSLRAFHSKLGPIVTLRMGSNTFIFITDGSLAHQALIQNGAVFADRPPATAVTKLTSSNQHIVSMAPYGPTWRLLRRNLTAQILHPSRVKSYSHARKWALQILLERFESQRKSGDPIPLFDHLQYAILCILSQMCFGNKLDLRTIREIEDFKRRNLRNLNTRFDILNFWPKLTRIMFRKRYYELMQLLQQEQDVYMPLIRERRKLKEERVSKTVESDDEYILSYVDTLFDLQLPEENRKLDEKEIVSLCSEFLNAGGDTTSTELQWIMANLVKYPQIQEKLFTEIKSVVGDADKEVTEDDLQKMPYLKAVVLESLRRHPPAHFVAPHAVTEDVMLNGFLLPKNASINFMVADMGRDSKVWDDPMAFKPERFLNSEENKEMFDITGSREIKMMPFGAGRRICPGLSLGLLHLEYFVANLILCYEWKAVGGDEISLEEKQDFLTVMKNPLQAYATPRFK